MSAQQIRTPSIAVVIPAYRSRGQIGAVLEGIGKEVSSIVVVDDCCPENTGAHVTNTSTDPRLTVLQTDQNLGVGGATKLGLRYVLSNTNAEVILKMDSDGQMDPSAIQRIATPVITGVADYAKGNRFSSVEDLREMPKLRILGNAVLSLFSKFSTGYWSVNDPTNGFLAFSREVLEKTPLAKIDDRWFFESDVLFRLSTLRASVMDVPLSASYGEETSNLKIRKVVAPFLLRHFTNSVKRISYQYYVKEWSAGSLELPAGLALFGAGTAAGFAFWNDATQSGNPATVGQVMLATVPIILGFQLLLSFISLDIASEPTRAQYFGGVKIADR